MRSPGLRVQFALALVAATALAVAVSAVLTGQGLRRTFDDYLQARVADAGRTAVSIAQEQYRRAGQRWSPQSLDGIAHDFALTGYDLRLLQRGRTLLDTSRPASDHGELVVLTRATVPTEAGTPSTTVEVLGRTGNGSFPGDTAFRSAFDHAHLIAALTAGGVAVLFGALAAGWLARPLRRLAGAARQLSEGARSVSVSARGPREVRELGAAIIDLSHALDRQEASRRHLAENLAHELRTPLMLIQGRIEAMQDGVALRDSDGIEGLHTEVLRLSRLVGQIERLASDEARPPKLQRVRVELGALATDAHRALAGTLELRSVAFDLDAERAPARGDADAIRQIATNLLMNAAKYAPSGSTVVLATRSSPPSAVLRVSDDGPQIPLVDRKRIFTRFARGTAATNAFRGAGLGLAIARELAESMGGTLDLVEGPGNTFELRLPGDLDARPVSRPVEPGAWPRRIRSR